MSFRSQFDTVAIDTLGNALANVEVSVFDAGTTNPVTIYSTRSGGGTLTNPITTPSNGLVQFWALPGSYDIKFEDTEIPARIATRTIGWEAVSGEDDGIAWVQVDTGTGIANADVGANAAIAGSKLDTGDGRLVQTTGLITSNNSLGLTGSLQDIPGATVTFTPDVNCYALVYATFEFEWRYETSAFGGNPNGRGYGVLTVDGTPQSAVAKLGGLVNHTVEGDSVTVGVRGTPAQIYRVSLTAASHTLKLQAQIEGSLGDVPTAHSAQFLYQLVAQ